MASKAKQIDYSGKYAWESPAEFRARKSEENFCNVASIITLLLLVFLAARWGWFVIRVIAFNFGYTIDFQF